MIALHFAPGQCLMQPDEVEALGRIVRQQAPRCVLEIGSYKGGSALVICEALPAGARLFMVDPWDQRDPSLWARIEPMTTFIQEASPDGLATAAALAGVPFDLAFIDGLHGYQNVRADIAGLIPVMRSSGTMVFHDAHHDGVQQAIDEAVLAYGLEDQGIVAGRRLENTSGAWGGLRQVVTP